MQTINEQSWQIDATDTEIAAAVEQASLPALMLAMVHISGDLSVIRSDVQPSTEFLSTDDGLTESQRMRVRKQAVELLIRYRDAPTELYSPNGGELREMLSFLIGSEIGDGQKGEEYAAFMTEELSLNGEDAYAQPEIFKVPESKRQEFKVLIIGAGMSGILAAIRLQEAGIGFEIVDKNDDVGGTWYENTYPGCRVDSANHVYSYSFRPQDWPQHFSSQDVLRQYFADTVEDYDLRPHIALNHEVTEARFDEASGTWHVHIVDAAGNNTERTANAIISAVGQLNRPRYPEITGLESFAGPKFHSARWNHNIDLAGKKVGVIGTGASAFQFVPIISEHAESVTVFQRTPPWVVPNDEYFQAVPDGKHWLLNHVPYYAKWFRFSMFWDAAEGLLHAVRAEPGWNRPEHSVGEANEQFRAALEDNLRAQLAGRDDLLAKCTPNYPPGAKRSLIDDGRWLQSLRRDNVALITDPISKINEQQIVTQSGDEWDVDVLIYATGFTASDFLMPMTVTGREGKDLHEHWSGDARAYKGITVPGFPNLFCCYGPNTNIVVNGSIVFFSECEVRYILGCLALLMAEQAKALDVRQEVHDEYNEKIDAGNKEMAWGQSGVNTWYKNAEGRITQNWPFTLVEFWQQTRNADASEYHLLR